MDSPNPGQEAQIIAYLADCGDDYVSGEVLSGKLGLSRAAVWKHVEQLRRRGYRIEAAPSKGYRLLQVPDRLTALELAPLLATREFARTVYAYDETGSTNAEANALAMVDAPHGALVVADRQTAGRGRRGRIWTSAEARDFTGSLVLRPDAPAARCVELTLLTAVALAEVLVDAGVPGARIKWPNDVHVGGRKVAGILTELSADVERVYFVIVGIGVNLNSEARDFPEEFAGAATSVRAERGEPISRALFVAALMKSLEAWYDRWTDEGFEPIRAAWRERTSTLGERVRVLAGGEEVRGEAVDIDESGALLVRDSGGVRRVIAGDVQEVRPERR